MTRWSVDTLSGFQSLGVKLVLLGGTMGVLYVAGWLPGASLVAPHGPRLATPPVRAAHVVRVDINHGSLEDLQALPGIGAVLAERIVQYRREHGNFMSTTEMRQVKGIGVKRLEQLRPYIRVGQPDDPSRG